MSDTPVPEEPGEFRRPVAFTLDNPEEIEVGGETAYYEDMQSLFFIPCSAHGEEKMGVLGVKFEGPVSPEAGDVEGPFLEVSERVLEFAKDDYGCDADASGDG